MSKYAGILPDLDTAPDVYETPDEPAQVREASDDERDEDGKQTAGEPGRNNTDVDRTQLDVHGARTKFKGAKWSGNNNNRTEEGGGDVPGGVMYSIWPGRGRHRDEEEEEQPVERLRRLRIETQELEEELEKKENAGESSNKQGALLSELRGLQRDLARMSVGDKSLAGDGKTATNSMERLRRLMEGKDEGKDEIEEEEEKGAEQKTNTEISAKTAKTSEMDARLALLEKIIGANEADTTEIPTPPLLRAMGRAEYQMQILAQPRHIDGIARRVKALVGDLDRAQEARRRLGEEGSGKEQVESVYGALQRVEELAPAVGPLVERLRGLQQVHSRAAEFSGDLQAATEETQRLQEAQTRLAEAVKRLEEASALNNETIVSNINSLSQRMDRLAEHAQ